MTVKDKQFLGRLNKSLGENELREYLADKKETAKSKNTTPDKYQLFDLKRTVENPKVLLIGPCITIPRYMQKRCIPPLGLSYVAASLEHANVDVSIIDCCVEGWDIERLDGNLVTYGLPPSEIEKRLEEGQYDIVGVSVLFSTDLPNLYEITSTVKKVLPNSTIVVGGLHPTIYPMEILELDLDYNDDRTIDFIIRGEGEHRFLDFINLYSEGKVNVKADGLVGFVDDMYFSNSQVNTIENIDDLPFPAFHLLPMEKYFKINIPFSPVPQGSRVIPMLTTRGCPIGCSFCANTNTWKRHRKRSTSNIIEEIKHMKAMFDVDEIQFADDNLTFDMKHSLEKFRAIKDENILWCTPNGTMINKLTPELVQTMAESGMYQITLSMDSANARTLKELHHKPVNLNSIPGLIDKCKEYGVFTHGTLVVGMPGETIDEIKEGFDYVKSDLHFTSVSAFIAAAIPGSELYHEMLDQGRITREQARQIDTTKSKININIDSNELEKEIENFQTDFMHIARERDPREYMRKYKKLIDSGRWDETQCGGKLT